MFQNIKITKVGNKKSSPLKETQHFKNNQQQTII